jgi:hypothetical protein
MVGVKAKEDDCAKLFNRERAAMARTPQTSLGRH